MNWNRVLQSNPAPLSGGKLEPTTITYHYRGLIERPTKRGYVWEEGYSAGEGSAIQYPWLTKTEARADARSQGAKATFARRRPALFFRSPR